MEKKKFSVAILGCGNRGAYSYGSLFYKQKDKYQIVSICEIIKDKLEVIRKSFDLEKENCFSDDEEFLSKKRADLLVIATQDHDHIRHCLKALEVGYKNILLEKPLTVKEEECYELLKAQNEHNATITVCHVLRYAPSVKKVNELINNNTIGKLISIQAIEQVHYWHYAHSYVRGNWAKKEETSPMILAKCCHDLDLLQYFVKSKCEYVSSTGSLNHFNNQNAIKDCALRCLDCKYIETCPYSAKKIYIDMWKQDPDFWPSGIVTYKRPITEEDLLSNLKNGPYGRCVYHCDNNVVDHQLVTMKFENGVDATLTMMGPTGEGGRIYKFYGSLGEIDWDEEKQVIEVKVFGKEKEVIDFSTLPAFDGAHGGADGALIATLYDILINGSANETSLEASIESHLMGIMAEKSRLENGKVYYIHK